MIQEVNFEIAKLLKEKGFDELCNNHYSQALFEGTNPDWEGVFPKYSVFKHSDSHYNSKPNNNDSWFECSAPTIAEVVMWLYEKHGVWVRATPIPYSDNLTHWRWEHMSTKYATRNAGFKKMRDYMSPTEAYEAAIEYVLKNLT